MLQDLLCLVDAHAHVTTLAPALTQRVIETLVRELAKALLGAFGQIHEMGLGAMLSVSEQRPPVACHNADSAKPSGDFGGRVPR